MTSSCTSSLKCHGNLPELNLGEVCGASAFVVFMSLLEKFIRSNNKISGACDRVKPIRTPAKQYDFVVMGGGSAGAVVASRLSENPDWKILVLEKGGDEPGFLQIPMLSGSVRGMSDVDWQYRTSNESHACLASNGSCSLSAGKVLGGSTSLSGMIYTRGSPASYDKWAALGNEGWSWADVKPYFLKSEDNGEIERVGRFYHATGGPVRIERFPYNFPFVNSVLAAADEAGYGVSGDLNGAQNTGFSISQTTSKNGVKISSSRAYLWPARNRRNLHISLHSRVTRILFKGRTAVGLEYIKNGKLKTVFATREVILSAGSIGSPQILLLSGIGPREHLESVKVKLVKDLPGVGENFHDHPAIRINFTVNESDKYVTNWKTAAQYFVNETGPLSAYGVVSVMAMLSTKSAKKNDPNLQVHFGGYTSNCAPGEVGALMSSEDRTVSIQLTNMDPESKGRVTLGTNDPLKYPLIWGNYLHSPSDVEVLVDGIEMVMKLTQTKAFRALNFTLSDKPTEACSEYTFRSKEYWACDIRQNGNSEWHPGGTCKMGPSSDPMAVVDHRLRVRGIKGLRIADNSILPKLPPCNTAALAMMIGERAADFIKADNA